MSADEGDSVSQDGEGDSEGPSTTGDAWVGSDATFHEFAQNGFRNKSEIAIAIAVEDRDQFNTKYRGIIEEKANEYGFSPKRSVLNPMASGTMPLNGNTTI